jgi:adenylate cyclase
LKKQRANPQAYEFYLRGKTFLNQESKKSLEYAVEMMQRAIASDPEYAPAYAGLCDTFCKLFQFWGARQSDLAQAEEASRKALQLAPDLDETHLSRGHVLSLMKRFDEAVAEFHIVLNQDPGSFEGHYLAARVLWSQGKMEECAAHYEHAAEIRPEDFRVRGLLVSVYRELKKPDMVRLWSQRTLVALQPWVEMHPDDSRAMYFAAGVNAELGNRSKAIEWAKKSIAVDPEDPAIYYNVACMYAILKEVDNSLDMLEIAIDKGFSSRSWIENDGDLAILRDHPRFKPVLDKIVNSDSSSGK